MPTTKPSDSDENERDRYYCSNCKVEFVDPIAELLGTYQEWAQCPRCWCMSYNTNSEFAGRRIDFNPFDPFRGL